VKPTRFEHVSLVESTQHGSCCVLRFATEGEFLPAEAAELLLQLWGRVESQLAGTCVGVMNLHFAMVDAEFCGEMLASAIDCGGERVVTHIEPFGPGNLDARCSDAYCAVDFDTAPFRGAIEELVSMPNLDGIWLGAARSLKVEAKLAIRSSRVYDHEFDVERRVTEFRELGLDLLAWTSHEGDVFVMSHVAHERELLAACGAE
jgi:hypothetical protein